MALVALHQRMGSHQRKAILVILDRIQGNIPTLDRVATFTIGAKLPTMNIGVAIGAMHTDVLEYEVGVALGAGNLLVQVWQFWQGVDSEPWGLVTLACGVPAALWGRLGVGCCDDMPTTSGSIPRQIAISQRCRAIIFSTCFKPHFRNAMARSQVQTNSPHHSKQAWSWRVLDRASR